jgi:hypothetical protein
MTEDELEALKDPAPEGEDPPMPELDFTYCPRCRYFFPLFISKLTGKLVKTDPAPEVVYRTGGDTDWASDECYRYIHGGVTLAEMLDWLSVNYPELRVTITKEAKDEVE